MRFLNPPLCPHAGCSPLPPSPEKVVTGMRQALAGRRILVVEDDPFIGLDIQGDTSAESEANRERAIERGERAPHHAVAAKLSARTATT
jgi:hypothetical protein